MKPKTLICNWKMNPSSHQELENLVDLVNHNLGKVRQGEVILAVPSLYIPLLGGSKLFQSSYFEVSAQDVSAFEKGAYTGQVSAAMLADLGVSYALIGHSETRKYLGVTEDMISKKISQALSYNLNPIICIGYQESKSREVDYELLQHDLEVAFSSSREHIQNQTIQIAYEPIWAIGSGVTPSCDTVETVIIFLKKTVKKILGPELAQNIKFIYGGSVNGDTVGEFQQIQELDGYLVGGASLVPKELSRLAEVIF